MPDFQTVKARLKELVAITHEELGGNTDFFIEQVDETKEYCGFLCAKDVKAATDTFKEINLKPQKDYHQTTLCLNLDSGKNSRLKVYNKTVHPLFASDSVAKKIGMGGK